MARLQDFQTVTPTDNDNLLVVQATGQGLAPVGSTLGAKMDKANPTGTGKLSMNRKSGSSEGKYSSTLGQSCTASGDYSHAEGYTTTASNDFTHAEGGLTTASGAFGHAEGGSTTASGQYSHSEGGGTTASGQYSHADGFGTIANHQCQHVFGSYNIADTSTAPASETGNYVEIVGKGSDSDHRSNARTLDWSGNETLSGDLIIKGSISVASGMTLRRLMYEATSGYLSQKTFTASTGHFAGYDRNVNTGMYIIQVHGWATTPKYAIFTAGFSGGRTANLNISQLVNIGSITAPTVSGGVITFSASTYSKIIVYALD